MQIKSTSSGAGYYKPRGCARLSEGSSLSRIALKQVSDLTTVGMWVRSTPDADDRYWADP